MASSKPCASWVTIRAFKTKTLQHSSRTTQLQKVNKKTLSEVDALSSCWIKIFLRIWSFTGCRRWCSEHFKREYLHHQRHLIICKKNKTKHQRQQSGSDRQHAQSRPVVKFFILNDLIIFRFSETTSPTRNIKLFCNSRVCKSKDILIKNNNKHVEGNVCAS